MASYLHEPEDSIAQSGSRAEAMEKAARFLGGERDGCPGMLPAFALLCEFCSVVSPSTYEVDGIASSRLAHALDMLRDTSHMHYTDWYDLFIFQK